MTTIFSHTGNPFGRKPYYCKSAKICGFGSNARSRYYISMVATIDILQLAVTTWSNF